MMAEAAPPLLVVEDDPNDLFFLERALQKAKLRFRIYVARNGDEAIQYLSGGGAFGDRQSFPIPKSILLDLKMPFVSGFQVLEWIRSQPHLSSIPVFVLTGSSVQRDREHALALGAKDYLVKPPTAEMLSKILPVA